MTRKDQGFTLIELMIVVAIIAIIAAIAVPNLLSSRVAANESNAISTLRNVVSAQAQFQTLGAIDADQDGSGEYAFFAELSGAAAGALDQRPGNVAPAGQTIDPPILGATFQNVDGNGNVNKSGYFFRIFLPIGDGTGVGEDANGGSNGAGLDDDNSEVFWCAYAWPVDAGTTGNRAFFVNQRGEILQTRMDNAAGPYAAAGPAWNDAFDPAAADMGGDLALGIAGGGSGHTWAPVQ